MTKKDFDARLKRLNLHSPLKVWCETREQERNVLEWLDTQGYRWRCGQSLIEQSYAAPLGLLVWEDKRVTYMSSNAAFRIFELHKGVWTEVSYDEFIRVKPRRYDDD